MKQFIKKIFLFSLPVLTGLGFIFFIKTNREFCYNYIKGDCDGRGKLLYKKMYEDNREVDYLFVGSSKTWNDVNDELLENLIGESAPRLFNVGYCRFGRNLDYLFCKEFLKHNKLKKIFLEVRVDESTTSHPIYPYLASGKEVLEGAFAMNSRLFPEIYNHLLMNINYSRCRLGFETAEVNTTTAFLHGYNNIEKTISLEKLDEFYNEEIKNKQEINTSSSTYRFSNYYLGKIKKLCDVKNIELVFLYLPSYANVNKTPAFKTEYEKWGKVIIGPDSIFSNKSYWKDVAHLNSFGADAYTRFLAKELAGH